MARKRERVFALVLAILFFVFSFGASIWVVWQLFSDNKEAKTVNQNTLGDTPGSQSKQKLEGKALSGFTPVSHIGQLQSTDTTVGSGDEAKAGDTVVVDYTGAVAATGIVFQSSLDSGQPASLSLDKVIDGWKQGIPGMKVGGTRRLLIPAAQAYGANPPAGSGIPANADLIFDVTLQAVTKQ